MKKFAGLNGFTVKELADAIGRSRMICYRAWRGTKGYGPTRRLILAKLPSVGGEHDSVRVPREFIEEIAKLLGYPTADVWQLLGRIKAAPRPRRRSWRILIEAWQAFLKLRHRFRLGGG